MARVFATLVLMLVLAVDFSPALAQERMEVAQRRTLFDMLFGEPEQQQQRPPVEQPRQQQPQQRQPAPRQQQQQPRSAPAPSPSASLPEPSVGVDKAEGATRLAVFGDSLASDLARALERLYAEDPNLVVLRQGVGSSGFVRDDFFDWNAAIEKEVAEDTFDLAVVIVGINDRQNLNVDGRSTDPLSEAWTDAYRQRIAEFIAEIRSAGKPVIWVGLPPMSASSYSSAISQISAIHKLAAVSAGAEFVDIYERFLGEDGRYSSYGPDLNGQNVRVRKDDGIHFSTAGSDKLAFFVGQAIRKFYREGGISVEVADPLTGTDAGAMLRPPFQGLGQIRLLEVAGAVAPLNRSPARAETLVSASDTQQQERPFSLEDLVSAPVGRADAFGAGIVPEDTGAEASP